MGYCAGVYYGEVPPVPIPNTEVKLTCAEDTWREAARKNRSSPASLIAVPPQEPLSTYSSLAQSVEHAAVNRRVVCSSQTGGAKQAGAWSQRNGSGSFALSKKGVG